MEFPSGSPTPPPGCPAHQSQNGSAPTHLERVPLHGPEFSADPQRFYEYLRQYGPAAPVEVAPGVPVTLVTEYSAALQVLQSPDLFSKDARRWRDLNEGRIPLDSPALPMMVHRPNALFADGAEHLRLRQAISDSLAKVDTHRLSRQVERISAYLIEQFSTRGTVDLIEEYAKLVSLLVVNDIFGCPAHLGDRLAEGWAGLWAGEDADAASKLIGESLAELVAYKRAQPGEDVPSWMLQHPSALSDEEMVNQLFTMTGAGADPVRNLIGTGLMLVLSDERFYGGQYGGALLVEDAVDEVLWNNPPAPNLGIHYPTRDIEFFGMKLSAGDPVVVSFAAANTDPALSASRQMLSKRAHLAWSAGPHACPAKDPATLMAVGAMEKLLNLLPDIELAVPVENLNWRPSPFQRGLVELPASFTPVQLRSRTPDPARPTAAAQPVDATPSTPAKGGWWSSFLARWR
ncbi:cytochrome P450 [Streptomyces hainanensis]|uniref:Cytochrome P450 n=1 Tax=Streptomyces hainanensis TaxID=402648 RepID=A0A4R4TF63_9ACTN|nr:cytochrome P450 [Streptomyces hainanensis]TDC76060.1 cytochrome P450 [Streptomyces hainanensis]